MDDRREAERRGLPGKTTATIDRLHYLKSAGCYRQFAKLFVTACVIIVRQGQFYDMVLHRDRIVMLHITNGNLVHTNLLPYFIIIAPS